jgi:hypothetical protein
MAEIHPRTLCPTPSMLRQAQQPQARGPLRSPAYEDCCAHFDELKTNHEVGHGRSLSLLKRRPVGSTAPRQARRFPQLVNRYFCQNLQKVTVTTNQQLQNLISLRPVKERFRAACLESGERSRQRFPDCQFIRQAGTGLIFLYLDSSCLETGNKICRESFNSSSRQLPPLKIIGQPSLTRDSTRSSARMPFRARLYPCIRKRPQPYLSIVTKAIQSISYFDSSSILAIFSLTFLLPAYLRSAALFKAYKF